MTLRLAAVSENRTPKKRGGRGGCAPAASRLAHALRPPTLVPDCERRHVIGAKQAAGLRCGRRHPHHGLLFRLVGKGRLDEWYRQQCSQRNGTPMRVLPHVWSPSDCGEAALVAAFI